MRSPPTTRPARAAMEAEDLAADRAGAGVLAGENGRNIEGHARNNITAVIGRRGRFYRVEFMAHLFHGV